MIVEKTYFCKFFYIIHFANKLTLEALIVMSALVSWL